MRLSHMLAEISFHIESYGRVWFVTAKQRNRCLEEMRAFHPWVHDHVQADEGLFARLQGRGTHDRIRRSAPF